MLKAAREEAGLTQEQLAKKLNTKKTAISRIENHAEDIKLSTLEKFAQALGKNMRIEVALFVDYIKKSEQSDHRGKPTFLCGGLLP